MESLFIDGHTVLLLPVLIQLRWYLHVAWTLRKNSHLGCTQPVSLSPSSSHCLLSKHHLLTSKFHFKLPVLSEIPALTPWPQSLTIWLTLSLLQHWGQRSCSHWSHSFSLKESAELRHLGWTFGLGLEEVWTATPRDLGFFRQRRVSVICVFSNSKLQLWGFSDLENWALEKDLQGLRGPFGEQDHKL